MTFRSFLFTLLISTASAIGFAQSSTTNALIPQDEFPPLGTCSFNPLPNQHNTPSPQNGSGSLGQIFNMSKCGLNYTKATQRLGKRGSLAGVNQPAPYTIAGIPVCRTIERAYIWASMSGTAIAFNVTIVNPLSQSFTFPAVNIGTGPDKCWGYGGTTSYRVDVTAAISGNGVYMISGFPTNPPTAQKDTDGATLFIIFSDPTANYQGHMIIHDGCVVGIGGNTAQTLTGINACANSIYARAFCMTGDWQLAGITGVWNGTPVNIPWNWWNYDEVATNVTAAQATAAYSHAGLNDCYNWVVMGLYYRTNTCTTCPLPNSLTLTTTTVPATCSNCNGSATVNATGGSAPYTYLWQPGNQTTQTATGLCAGTYTVTVTDATGCLSATTTVVITSAGGGLTLTPTIVNVLCNGQCNGSIALAVTGGSAPYTYLWTPGNQTGQTATGLCAGSYSVTVTDASGCTSTGVYTVTQPPALSTTQSQVNILCNGQCTGTATVTASGGTPGYTYSWAPSGGNAATATGLCAGNYTVTVTDANGCTRTATYTITQPPALSTTQSQVNVLCNGQCTGTATVTASGGTPGYTYSWAPSGGNAATATGLCAGNYTVTVTDANGCTRTATYTITQPTALSTTQSQVNVLCNGQCTGSATVTASGGTPGYTYTWAPSGGNAATATGLCAGNYTVTVTDANGCTRTATYTITQPPALSTTQSQVNVLCNGQCTGTATVTASGGTAPYSYTWAPSGGNAATATGLCAGNYTVTVTDANGCTRTATYTITQPPALSATTSTTISTCGQPNGSASVTVTGGTPAYSYSWAPSGGNASTATGLNAGSYTVTITDANGCTITAVAVVVAAGSPTITITGSTNVSCFGGNNGSANTSTTGGTAPYTYSWSPSGGNSANATGLTAGNYTVTVTDANGCTSTATVTITQPTALTVSLAMTPVLCNGGNTGTATATASGGTGPYSYAWAPSGGNAATATGLNANTYTVTVTDANGCTVTASITVTQPTALTATQTQVNVLCNGQCTASGTVTASGGTAPYTYAWSPSGGNAATATGLCAGNYTCTVTDANGCTFNVIFTITQPTAMSATTSFVQATCGQANGSASVTVTGGTPAYTYAWAPSGGNASTATGLLANTYTVTITDANGCTLTATVTVPNAANPTVVISASTNVSCFGGNNGSASVTASGGTQPYTYAWSPSGGNTANATGLTANTYTCVVTDANGCTTSTVVTITQPTLLTITATNTGNVLCNGGNTGSASSTPTGGTSPYTFAWTPSGGNGQNATGLSVGTYTVTVTDANGCTATATVVITQPPLLSVTSAGFSALCNGSCNGQVVCIPAGGTQPFSILWTPGNATTPSVNGLCAGTYTVLITDANGCTVTDTAIVSQPAPITATTLADTSHCNLPDGSVCVTPNGGTAPYTYNWNSVPPQNTTCATGLTPGQYCVTITDANGCTLSVCDNVPLALGVIATITVSTNATCFGTCNGSAIVNATGGIGPYTYSWSPSNQTTTTATGLCAGVHTCTVTDASGCSDTAVVTITQPPQLVVTTANPAPICIGQCVTLTATITGGTPSYITTWTPAGPNVCPTTTTTYTVNVTDANGCTTTAQTVTVTVNPPLNVSATVNPGAICVGSSASLNATGNGGSGSGYNYTWNPGNLQGSNVNVSPTATTTYTVTLTDNCGTPSATATVTLTVNPLPVLATIPADSSCAPFCTTFTDLTPNATSWNWSFSGGTPSSATTSPTPQVCWVLPGTYNVTLTVTDNNGCSNTGLVSTVVVHPNPTAAFTPDPDSVSVLNPEICFTNNSILASTYMWDFGNPQDQNNTSTQTNPCHLYGDTGTYCVQLIAISPYGCRDSVTECVYVMPDFTLYVPNAFTPDGNGVNEFFLPLGEGIDKDKFEMWVFDRWGNNIWYTQIWGKGWDGRANGGQEIAQEDVYVWKIVVYDYLGKKHAYVGHVSLIK